MNAKIALIFETTKFWSKEKWRVGSPDLLHIDTFSKIIIAILARETAVAECEIAVPKYETAVAEKKSYSFSKSGTTFW